MNNIPSVRLTKKQAMEQAWLLYYNQVLFEQGVISEDKRNKMKHLIHTRYNPGVSRRIPLS